MRTDLPFIVHEFKVYVRNMSDIELHQEIVGQWNATKDFDEDEMNILIEELARRAKAQEAENVYKNVDNVNISEECVHKTDKSIHEAVAWMWKDGTLTSDPDFADGTWTPLFTSPVHASDISQERVDKTAKGKHEWVGLTHWEMQELMSIRFIDDAVLATEAKLKEKNT